MPLCCLSGSLEKTSFDPSPEKRASEAAVVLSIFPPSAQKPGPWAASGPTVHAQVFAEEETPTRIEKSLTFDILHSPLEDFLFFFLTFKQSGVNLINIFGTTLLKRELWELKPFHTCSAILSSSQPWKEAGKWAILSGQREEPRLRSSKHFCSEWLGCSAVHAFDSQHKTFSRRLFHVMGLLPIINNNKLFIKILSNNNDTIIANTW